MKKLCHDRRKYERYETELDITFHVKYHFQTKVSFRLIKPKVSSQDSYEGITRNISVEGLRFFSSRKLNVGDLLYLELFLPKQKKPICMTGKVRWSRKLFKVISRCPAYDTGVKLTTIGSKKVSPTIHLEKKYGVYWSAVLESILGSFKKIVCKHQILG